MHGELGNNMFEERQRRQPFFGRAFKRVGLTSLVLSLGIGIGYSCGTHDGRYHRKDKSTEVGESFYGVISNLPFFHDHETSKEQRKKDDLYQRLNEENSNYYSP